MIKLPQTFAATPQNYNRNNKWFAFVLTAGLGILGSGMSVMISSAFAIIFVLQLLGVLRTSDHPDIWKIALLFLAYFLVNTVLSLVHFDGGRNLNVIVESLPFLAFFPLVMALSYTSRSELRNYLELGASIGSILTLAVVLYEYSQGVSRAEGANGNPGPFALSISIAYALCLFGLFRSSDKMRSLLMITGATAAFICLLASGMRAMWPALILLILIAGWGQGFYNFRKRWLFYTSSLLIASLVAYMIFGNLVIDRFAMVFNSVDQIINKDNYSSSLGERVVMWKFAWQNMPEALWIGLGEAKAISGMDVFAKEELGYSNGWNHFHNFIVNAVMRGGIPELLAMLALLFGPLVIAWKHRRDEISRYGFALMLAIVLIFVESGMLGITFGHDIMDHLYTYMLAVSTWLVIGGTSGSEYTANDKQSMPS
ncbi:MAG: O-antigen ligase family protein [Rhizobiaceae bacterium]|nr:O-antigen ligase family protein [Rhizobiaceae bacterium]